MLTRILIALVVVCCMVTTTFGAIPTSAIYLSDLTWISATNGFGPVEKDMGNGENATGDGRTITLNGVTYTKGLGVHAAADVQYDLSRRQCSSFMSDIGVDDEVQSNGSVVFQVFADGINVYDSGTMTGSSTTKNVNIDISGKEILQLKVTNGGDNLYYDHADWANAQVICASLSIYTITAAAETGGGITPAGEVTVAQGASQTFTIAANSGYQIADVKVDGVSVGAVSTYTFSNVMAAHTIAAPFAAIPTSQTMLSWNAPTTNADGTPLTDLEGYKVYYGTSSGNYSQNVDAGNVTTYTVANLTDGLTYYFVVTAYDTSGNESVYSNEVSRTIDTLKPDAPKLSIII